MEKKCINIISNNRIVIVKFQRYYC